VTPEELRKLADEIDKEAEAKARAGDKEGAGKLWDMAEEARYRATQRERAAKVGALRPRNQRGNKKVMVNPARVRISAGADERPDELVAKANAAGYTLRSLAEAVDCSHALLSQARRGERTIKRQIAEAVEKLTGFKATKANWPRGIRD
jgi:hypothetical protein